MSVDVVITVLQIIWLNIILSGDNAVVIAMAVRSLQPRQKRLGIFWGSFGAVALRIALTFIVVMLLNLPGLRFVGGLTLVWITWKLVRPSDEGEDSSHVRSSESIFEAVKIVIVADLIMSLDNVLAVAGAAGGNMLLIIFGLATSIPIILCCSALISTLMNRYPFLVLLGGLILGHVAAELLVTDPMVAPHVAHAVEFVFPWAAAILIVALARRKELVARFRAGANGAVVK